MESIEVVRREEHAVEVRGGDAVVPTTTTITITTTAGAGAAAAAGAAGAGAAGAVLAPRRSNRSSRMLSLRRLVRGSQRNSLRAGGTAFPSVAR